MVQLSRALGFFALASTAFALAVTSDATGVKVGNTDGIAARIENNDPSVKSKAFDADVTSVENKFMVNATSAGIVELVIGTMAIRPGSTHFIQNNEGYFLSRLGYNGLGFSKTTPDVPCTFRAERLIRTDYVTLRADNGLFITVDYRRDPTALWLDPRDPVAAFDTVSAGDGKEFLVVRDVDRPQMGPWAVTGEGTSDDTIAMITYPAPRFYALYFYGN
ncbi:hypothetical protein B0H16DRAFT_1737778 [Mycena metata]|uniref:Uncharacterized protein n=1 Tax=Mycena metata TaxID=1033252 RepID=A0AAD7MLN8_9AGAR|nr:hypothetical protein B0H16DRAFT_1737778 [Mycena metata]